MEPCKFLSVQKFVRTRVNGASEMFYDVSIARNSKVHSGFSRVSCGEFFQNFAEFEIQTLSLIYLFLKKICQSNSVKWLKIRNHVISVKPSERPIFFPLQNVISNHFHKIGKFKKNFTVGKSKYQRTKTKYWKISVILCMLCCHDNVLKLRINNR